MGEIVNLRTARRRRERAEQEALATANRARFGRTGAEKRRDALERDGRERALDNARLDEPDRTEP